MDKGGRWDLTNAWKNLESLECEKHLDDQQHTHSV